MAYFEVETYFRLGSCAIRHPNKAPRLIIPPIARPKTVGIGHV